MTFVDLEPIPWNGSAQSNTYTYEPLRSKRHIRLLRIVHFDQIQLRSSSRPGAISHQSRISPHYEIVQVNVTELPQYTAFSYAWGKPDRNHALAISGSCLPITESVASGLRRLQWISSTGHLWIDQVCIDQSNVQERNQQVQIMGEIYGNAKEVTIWTGEEVAGLIWMKSRISFSDALSEDHRESLYQLLCRPWFSRAWVVQEAVLAKTAMVVAGTCQIPLQDLFRAYQKRGNYWTVEQLREIKHASITLTAVMTLREDYKPQSSWELGFDALLNHLGESQVSDLRDHVYAFLGLQNDGRVSIVPDYTLTTSQVFTRATRAIIEGTNSLSVFRFLPIPSTTRKDTAWLPSWVPNWSKRNYDGRILRDPWVKTDMKFKAANDYCHQTHQHDHLQENELRVTGRTIDNVKRVLPITLHDRSHGHPRYFSLSDDQVIALDKTAFQDPEEALRERLLTVLLAGRVRARDHINLDERDNISTAKQLLQLYDRKSDESASWFGSFEIPRTRLTQYELIQTQAAKLGLAPNSVCIGDKVVILHGLEVPLILRQLEDGPYKVIGQCYLEDAMYGEAVTWEEDEGENFVLV